MTRLVLSRHLPDHAIDRITAAVPGIEIVADPRAVLPASGRVGLLYREEDRTEPTEVAEEELVERWSTLLRDADVLFDVHPLALELIGAAPRLRFIQAIAAGAGEYFAHASLRESNVSVTTARGVHDDALADFALAGILAHAKRFHTLRVQQTAHDWTAIPARRLFDSTLVVVGFGSIGRAIATRARAFGIRVTGVRTRPGTDDLAERIYGVDELDSALGQADFIANTLPATDSTVRLFNSSRFAAAKPGSFLVNVGRGTTIDEAAMIDALKSGQLGGAAIDVATIEPLPSDDPLWDAPNLLISPHCASLIPGAALDAIVDILIANLQLHERGEPLINIASRPAAA